MGRLRRFIPVDRLLITEVGGWVKLFWAAVEGDCDENLARD